MDVFAATQVYPVTGARGTGDTMRTSAAGRGAVNPGLAVTVIDASTIAGTEIEKKRGGIVISPSIGCPIQERTGPRNPSDCLTRNQLQTRHDA